MGWHCVPAKMYRMVFSSQARELPTHGTGCRVISCLSVCFATVSAAEHRPTCIEHQSLGTSVSFRNSSGAVDRGKPIAGRIGYMQ